MFIMTAAPPNNAAAPIAPVFIGIAAPELEEAEALAADVAALFAAPPPAVLMLDVGVGTPEVNGALLAELAPAKAGAWVVWLGLAVAVLFAGLRTPSITWITPLEVRTFGTTTCALLTKTEPFEMVMRMLPPARVLMVSFLRRVL